MNVTIIEVLLTITSGLSVVAITGLVREVVDHGKKITSIVTICESTRPRRDDDIAQILRDRAIEHDRLNEFARKQDVMLSELCHIKKAVERIEKNGSANVV